MGGWFTSLDLAHFLAAAMLRTRGGFGLGGGFRSPEPHRHGAGSRVLAWRASGPAGRPNGVRERARRRRHIACGRLRAENGLVRA